MKKTSCSFGNEDQSYEEYADNCLISEISGLKDGLHLHEELGNHLTTAQKKFLCEYNPKGFTYMRQRPVVDAQSPNILKCTKRVTFGQVYTLYANMCTLDKPHDPLTEVEDTPDMTINFLFLTRINCLSGKEAKLLTRHRL